jgi:hypothetical protein
MIIVLHFPFLHVTMSCIPHLCDVRSWPGSLSPSSVHQHDVTSHCFLTYVSEVLLEFMAGISAEWKSFFWIIKRFRLRLVEQNYSSRVCYKTFSFGTPFHLLQMQCNWICKMRSYLLKKLNSTFKKISYGNLLPVMGKSNGSVLNEAHSRVSKRWRGCLVITPRQAWSSETSLLSRFWGHTQKQ